MVAAAIGVGAAAGLAGSAMQAGAASDAASTQADASNRASQLQWQQFQQMQQNLKPYMDLGTNTIPQLQQLLGSGALSRQFNFNPTQQQLEQTPGYQFTLQQGNKAIDNAMAAKGLSLSGAQMKGLDQYNTGLASQTFQQQYNNALQQFSTNYGVNSDQYNRLAALLGLGQNAAAGVGNAGIQTGTNVANLMTGAANAQAAGQIGASNAIAGGLSGLGNSAMLYGLMRPQGGGSGGSWSSIYSASDPTTYFNDPAAYG
ncbi:DNA transfer protein p32 [Ralstonia pseudosolanacearum]|uniref:DNA transfer protein p32 n=1 Tax=Ralstonia pseudosolanacearum TaxID=1310165 RepID=UPI0011C36324